MLPDVVVVGAGAVGAACAYALRRAGLRVEVVDRGAPASGTTASGEGNVLVSDKEPGPELELALASRRRWVELLAELAEEGGAGERGGCGGAGSDSAGRSGVAAVEWEAKGGLTVATGDPAALYEFAAHQRAAGVDARLVDEPWELEPHLSRRVTGAVHYPQDAQVQPVGAALAMLRGIPVRAGVTALGLAPGGLRTSEGVLACGAVVNAAGPWAGEFAAAAGAPIRVLPRRGMVLVTGPLPEVVRHKVYDGDYVGAVASGDAGLQTSAVVEATRAGTVLIGSSRERVGFDETVRVRVLRELAAKAVGLFPALGKVPVMRAYGGFRPYAPDHLPIIGADPRVPGLWHATGHEGAGIGLAPATGELLADLMLGRPARVDPEPFRVGREAVLG